MEAQATTGADRAQARLKLKAIAQLARLADLPPPAKATRQVLRRVERKAGKRLLKLQRKGAALAEIKAMRAKREKAA